MSFGVNVGRLSIPVGIERANGVSARTACTRRGVNDNLLPRTIKHTLEEILRIMPAVVVTGARQTGKSTLARELAPGNRRVLSLDDFDTAQGGG